jgi:hypothetical protein
MPDDRAELVVTAARLLFCRRAVGEAVTWHSLRPFILEGQNFAKARALDAAGRLILAR